MNKIQTFRAQKDEFFEFGDQSPLTPDQKKEFEGLNYYPVREDFRFELEVEKYTEPQEIQMQTSTGDLRTFTRFGRVTFEVDGLSASLTIFSNEHGFFVPFVDAGAGKVTYGAGRYLDPELNEAGNLVLDFNLAYNPYCAYNDLYSCPIPPAENRLSVAIKAGEMNFK